MSDFSITPVYDRLLMDLHRLHIAMPEQLCILHNSPNSVELIKTRLRHLTKHGYVQRDRKPTKLYSSPYYYALGNEGIRYLKARGVDISDSFRARKEVDKHSFFVQHTLEVNDILVSAMRLEGINPLYSLAAFQHERELKRDPRTVVWRDETLRLVPDAFLDFRLILPDGKRRRLPILLEHDCDTEFGANFRSKIRAYAGLLKSGKYAEWFGIKSLRVAFSTFAGEKRREYMRKMVSQELQGEPSALAQLFIFTSQEVTLKPECLWLQPCWYGLQTEPPFALLCGG